MNIDQRIEALTQSLELLAHMYQDSESRWQTQFAGQETRWTGRFEKLLEMSDRTDRRINALLDMIEGHEQRLNKLEGGR